MTTEDFCSRMVTRGVRVVSTHFVSQEFFGEHGFRVDRCWGGLVCFLKPQIPGIPFSEALGQD